MFQFTVNDFQSIEDAKISVDGLTLIQGDSNAGKSATLRALQSACMNRFRQGQVRYGTDHATIRVKTPESSEVLTVVRPWTGSLKMKLGDRIFTKLGRTLPSEVTSFLDLGFLDVCGDSYSLNFHPQFQPPLLLGYSQQKVMEILSASTALDDLKETKEALLNKRLSVKGAITTMDSLLEDTTLQLHEVSTLLDTIAPLVKTLTEIENEISSLPVIPDLPEVPDTSLLETKVAVLTELVCLPLIPNLPQVPDTSIYEDYTEILTTIVALPVVPYIPVFDPTELTNLDNMVTTLQDLTSLPVIPVLPDCSVIDARISDLDKVVNQHICPICGHQL